MVELSDGPVDVSGMEMPEGVLPVKSLWRALEKSLGALLPPLGPNWALLSWAPRARSESVVGENIVEVA